jgi:hypothetical protein
MDLSLLNAEAAYAEDRPGGKAMLTWPLSEPMHFYTVVRVDDGSPSWLPFVKDFHYAMEAASIRQAREGGTWQVDLWAWDHEHDEAKFVRVAGIKRSP